MSCVAACCARCAALRNGISKVADAAGGSSSSSASGWRGTCARWKAEVGQGRTRSHQTIRSTHHRLAYGERAKLAKNALAKQLFEVGEVGAKESQRGWV